MTILKFFSVGLINAIVGALSFLFLIFFIHSQNWFVLLVINTIAVVASITSSYFLNNSWTFKHRKNKTLRGTIYFYIVGFINILMNDIFFYVFLRIYMIYSNHLTFDSNIGIKIASSFIASLITFVILSNTLYRV